MVAKEQWLPLAEYAIRTGISISTIRRRIKANAIGFKLDDGKYLISMDAEDEPKEMGFVSTDSTTPTIPAMPQENQHNDIRWRALEARVAGLAKKVDMLSEQLAEAKMLVKVFEEKMDEIH